MPEGYRKLQEGEVVKEGGELFDDVHDNWIPAKYSIGNIASSPEYTCHLLYRRKENAQQT